MKKFVWMLLAMSLAACGEQGNDFIGKWQSAKSANDTVQIEKNGDSFLIKHTSPSMFKRGEMDTSNIPAAYKDGLLQVQTGIGALNVTYVKANDTLLMPTMGGSAEYKRVK